VDAPGGCPYSGVTKPDTGNPREAKNMSLIQSVGPEMVVALLFFGVLLVSTTTAVIALLADY
jgi:hypothetical protein